MKIEGLSWAKLLSPRLLNKVIQTFDKGTMVIVASSWGVAVLLMSFALYTVHLSVTARRSAIEAAAQEPALPKLVARPPESKELMPIVERMKKRFPDITFNVSGDQSLTVSANEGPKFRTWLGVLSYIDTVSPQYRWQIKEFCVGMQCSAAMPMRAILIAQKITFTTTAAK
ncbi:MAG TPA: hypothetical protein DCY07_06020 [Rhodospirillaceae bacterium]|nr:hypothetical protein [Rhodospirillaceae bacterium]